MYLDSVLRVLSVLWLLGPSLAFAGEGLELRVHRQLSEAEVRARGDNVRDLARAVSAARSAVQGGTLQQGGALQRGALQPGTLHLRKVRRAARRHKQIGALPL